jgi:hypothetical protein
MVAATPGDQCAALYDQESGMSAKQGIASLDYQGIYDPGRRVEMQVGSPAGQADPLVLVGSSMGGLFRMAPHFILLGTRSRNQNRA